MKKISLITLTVLLTLCLSAFTIQSIINWKINQEMALVKFKITGHGADVLGDFKGVKGEVKFDPADPANASIKCSIDASTVNTGVPPRDKHLQAGNWLDVESFPEIVFQSTTIKATADGYLVDGNLTAKEITKPVTIPMQFKADQSNGSFTGTFTINRTDFKIGKGSDDIGNPVNISFDIPVTKGE
jgi:polyisoprenoid-binding protein YceI